MKRKAIIDAAIFVFCVGMITLWVIAMIKTNGEAFGPHHLRKPI